MGDPATMQDAADTTTGDEQVPLLLHSLAHLRELWLPLLDAAEVRSVTEIGSETGVTTSLIADWLAERDGRLVTIDPDPADPLVELEKAGRLQLVRGLSPEALEGLEPTDAYLIDGDHNYSVVARELAAIAAAHDDDEVFPLVVLHDVGWPSGRRDQYYSPDALPAEDVHPHTWHEGVRPGRNAPGAGGFRGEGEFAWSRHEGGERNGVLTAVEDFLDDHGGLKLVTIPSVFGLGVLYSTSAPYARKLTALLAGYHDNPFLTRLERNRIALFVRVLDLQDELGVVHGQLAQARDSVRRVEATSVARAARAEARELELQTQLVDLDSALRNALAREEAARAELAAVRAQQGRSLPRRVAGRLRRLLASAGSA